MALLKARKDNPAAPPAPPRGIAGLIDDLAGADARGRRAAARDIAGHPQAADATQALATALAAESDRAAQEALLGALTTIATPAAIGILTGGLGSENAWLRNAMIRALQEIGPAAAAGMHELLRHPDPDLRIAALMTLGGMRDAAAAPLVAALLLRDSDSNVCAAAVETLEQIGGADALPALRGLARRFPGEPFLAFAAEAVCQRLCGGSP